MPKIKRSQTEEQDNQFRAAIAYGIEMKGLTVDEIARYIDVSLPTFRKHKREPSKFTIGEFRKLCNRLDFTPEQVCGICGVKYT